MDTVASPSARRGRPSRPWVAWLWGAALSLFTLLFVLPARAAFTPPELHGHVVDTAGKLTGEDADYLEQKLERIRQKTGVDIVAFVAGSLEGEDIEDVAYKAFNTWKLGQKGADNGVLLVIAPAERRIRIETGKGVGGALTDLQTNDIIRRTINPLLQQDRLRDAIDQGTTAIAKTMVQGSPEGSAPVADAKEPPSLLKMGLMIGLGLLVLILAIVSPTFRHFLFFFLLLRPRRRGRWRRLRGRRRRRGQGRELRRRRVKRQLLAWACPALSRGGPRALTLGHGFGFLFFWASAMSVLSSVE